jgi:hypothetical protein
MENKTSFDLNGEIRRWRDALALSPEFCGQDIDELECHLSDSLVELQNKGLSEEEAFIIATRRLGSVPALAKEFGRVNNPALWTDRLLWMVLGCAFIGIVRSFYAMPLILFIRRNLPPYFPVVIWSIPLILAGFIVRSAVQPNGYVRRMMSSLLCRPAVLSLGLIVVGFAPSGLLMLAMNEYMFLHNPRIAFETFAASFVWLVVMALFVFALARRRLRLARS